MKKAFTHPFSLGRQVSLSASFLFLSFLFLSTQLNGQTANAKPDYSYLTTVSWKSAADMNDVFVQEQSKMDVALTQPAIQPVDRAVYSAYKRLLTYVQADQQGGVPLSEAIPKNLDKVALEAPKDAQLALLPDGFLDTFIPFLVESLTEAQKAIPVSAN